MVYEPWPELRPLVFVEDPASHPYVTAAELEGRAGLGLEVEEPGRRAVVSAIGRDDEVATLGVLRCAVYGMRRFGEFERELGIATNVLSDRLLRLVDAGVLERVQYQANPPRNEYVLTAAGRELTPVVLALKAWGDRHLQEDGAWTSIRHRGCESLLEVVPRCPDCGTVVPIEDTEAVWLRSSA